jgi:S-adenosylmethionine-diacylglycerol 3-amino-3-carboxypropyl transferase
MNTRLLAEANACDTTLANPKGVADRIFHRWFNRLIYAQIWEDPVVDLEALALKPGEHLITIASGGCNALAYLSANPGAVHVVDLNEAHLAMLDMKRTAFANLPRYEDLLAFAGNADHPGNAWRYERFIATNLGKRGRAYWESCDWLGRPRYSLFSRNAYRFGLLGRFIGVSHILVRILGGNLAKVAEARSLAEQAMLFEEHVAPVFDHPLVRLLARQPLMLYSLGISSAQFRLLEEEAARQGLSMAHFFRERLRRLACDFPLVENCFAGQAFSRRYDTTANSALPLYLQRQHYETIRRNLGRIQPRLGTLIDVLRDQPGASLDAYLLLDSQDWLDREDLIALWVELTRTAAAGARVVFRSGGSNSPLDGVLPPLLQACWRTDPVRNAELHRKDRSAMYGGTFCYVRV